MNVLWCSHLNNIGLVIAKVQLPGALLCVASLRFTAAKKSGWDFHTSHISMDSQESTSFFMAGSWINHWRDQKCHSPMIYFYVHIFPIVFSLHILNIQLLASWIWQIHRIPWFKKCGILCRGRTPLDRFVMFLLSLSARFLGHQSDDGLHECMISLSVSLYICTCRIQVAKNKLIRPSWYYIPYIYIWPIINFQQTLDDIKNSTNDDYLHLWGFEIWSMTSVVLWCQGLNVVVVLWPATYTTLVLDSDDFEWPGQDPACWFCF